MAAREMIFTADDFDRLKTAQRVLHDLLPKFDKATACGVECEGYRAIHAEMLRLCTEIERNYLPLRPE